MTQNLYCLHNYRTMSILILVSVLLFGFVLLFCVSDKGLDKKDVKINIFI